MGLSQKELGDFEAHREGEVRDREEGEGERELERKRRKTGERGKLKAVSQLIYIPLQHVFYHLPSS